MTIKIRHKIAGRGLSLFLILNFAFHFLLQHGALAEFVLCIGSDGHIAVERSLDDTTCSDVDFRSHLELVNKHNGNCCILETNHCGDCRDISLTADCQDEQARISKNPLEISPKQLVQASVSADFAANTDLHYQKPAAVNPAAFHQTISSLQITVLLI